MTLSKYDYELHLLFNVNDESANFRGHNRITTRYQIFI